jgi:hypothetical protein
MNVGQMCQDSTDHVLSRTTKPSLPHSQTKPSPLLSTCCLTPSVLCASRPSLPQMTGDGCTRATISEASIYVQRPSF